MLNKLSACVLLLMVWAGPAHAITLLSEGWEGACSDVSGRWSLGSYYTSANGGFPCGYGIFGDTAHQPFFLDSGTKLFGSNSLRYNYVGTQYQSWQNSGGYVDKQFSQNSAEIWITFYNRMSAGFQTAGGAIGGAGTKGPYSFMISDTKCVLNNVPYNPAPCGSPGATLQQNGWVFHYMWGGRQLIMTAQGIKDASPAYQTQNLQHNIQQFNQPDLKWVCHEAHIRLNTPGQANGLYEQYATNVSDSGPTILTTRYLNREFIDSTPTGQMPSDAKWHKARTYRQDGLGQMWYDGLTYSTTRLGCTGGGGTSDTTGPTAPIITSIAKTTTTATVNFTGSTDADSGVLNYLVQRCTPNGCTSYAQIGAVNHVDGTTTYSLTNTGLTAGTVYSYRTIAQDNSGNLSAVSNAMSVTTDASSALPTMVSFTPTASGGTVVWSTSPATAFVKFKYGGAAGVPPGEFTRAIADIPGGVLTFQWPQTTTYAGSEAGTAGLVFNTDPNATRYGPVVPQPAVGPGGALHALTTNPRYLTTDDLRAIYLAGRSQVNHYQHDVIAYNRTDLINGPAVTNDTFDGTGSSTAVPIEYVSITDAPNSPNTGGNFSYTVSYPVSVSAGSNRILVLSAQSRRSSSISPASITGCTFNGSENFTFVRRDEKVPGSSNLKTELWYLVAPTETTANVVCSYANNQSDLTRTFSVSYLTGVSQSAPIDASAGSNGTSTTLSTVVTTVAQGAWIIDSAYGRHDAGLTVGSGQTTRTDRLIILDGLGVSTVNGKATPGAETMDWTQGSDDWSYSAMSLKPAIGPDVSGLGTGWTLAPGGVYSPLTKSAGVALPSSVTGYADNAEIHDVQLDGNQWACTTMGTFNDAGPQKIGITARMQSGTNSGYKFLAQRNTTPTSAIIELNAGTPTTLVSNNTETWAANDVLCARLYGKTLEMTRNAVVVATASDYTFKHGNVGLVMGGTNAAGSTTVTEFRAGNIAGAVNAGSAATNYIRGSILEQTATGSAATLAAGEHVSVSFLAMPYVLEGVRDDTSTGTTMRVGVYDLDRFNEDFFTRQRNAVLAANASGKTLSIMLFNPGAQSAATYAGFSHPFSCPTSARCNNINSTNADTNDDGKILEAYATPASNPVFAYQTAFVNKMVDTLNDLDGFFFEIADSQYAEGTAWQTGIYDAIRAREASQLYRQHAVAMTKHGWSPQVQTSRDYLRNASPSIIGPSTIGSEDYTANPPSNFSAPLKVTLVDSAHLSGAMPSLWSWTVFLRGGYPVLLGLNETAPELAVQETQMAQTRLYAEKIALHDMYPENTSATDIFNTSFGLSSSVNGGTTRCAEYLMLIPTDIAGTIDLSKYNCTGGTTFDVEYLNVTTGVISSGGTTTGGAVRSFNPAGSDPMVVYLKATTAPADTVKPILSGGSPNTILPSGTTSTTMSVLSTEVCEAKYDDMPGIAHASKVSTFSTTNTVVSHQTTVGSLTNGTAYLKYVTCRDPAGNVSLEYPISWSVAPGVDTTQPTNASAVTGTSTNSGTAILWEWVEGTDDNLSHHILEISAGEVFLPPAILTVQSTTGKYTQSGLSSGQTFIGRVKAVDHGGLQSPDWSQSTPVIVALPETMTGLIVQERTTTSAVILVNPATQAGAHATFEICTGVDCNSGWTSAGSTVGLLATFTGLTAETTYGVRGKWSNALGGTSEDWSTVMYVTTAEDASITAICICRNKYDAH